jgi:hypothetical protein
MDQEEVQASPSGGAFMQGSAQKMEPAAKIPGLAEGRMVHYVLTDGSHRPAVVVRDWKEPSGSCNLQVLLDGSNDRPPGSENCTGQEAERGIAWRTSVQYHAAPDTPVAPPCPPHTWHWPEKA